MDLGIVVVRELDKRREHELSEGGELGMSMVLE